MKRIENMTKKELIEFIEGKQEEIRELRKHLDAIGELEVYADVADKIKGMYDKLVNRGFSEPDALNLVDTMISSGIISNRRLVSNVNYYSRNYR